MGRIRKREKKENKIFRKEKSDGDISDISHSAFTLALSIRIYIGRSWLPSTLDAEL